MNRFPISYSNVVVLLENAELRSASDHIRTAYETLNAKMSEAGCSSCARRKRINEVYTNLVENLKKASDMEIDRIKKVLKVDALVFGSGTSFIER